MDDRAWCVNCRKWTKISWESCAKYGRGERRGFATCCGRVVGIAVGRPLLSPEITLVKVTDRRSSVNCCRE